MRQYQTSSSYIVLALLVAVIASWSGVCSATKDEAIAAYENRFRSVAASGANASSAHVVHPAFKDWDGTILDEDPLAQVSDFLDAQETDPLAFSALQVGAKVGAKKVHGFCEICILIMQMKERGQPHICAGLNPDYYVTCIENLESILRADKAVAYWLRSGCMHLDREGPEVVKPCPAHAVCAWVPNLFADVGIVTPRNELAPLCPKDFKYLPRIPRKPAAAGGE